MMNPDGVFLGNYRSTLMGFDLNRSWHQISRWAHPTLHAVHDLLTELDASKETELDMVIDLHAHSSLQGVFIYGNTYDDVYRYERHIVFPKLLAQNAEDYLAANTMYNRDVGKAGTTRRYFCGVLKDSVNCYTLEVSFYGYQRPNSLGIFYYTEEAYCRLGRNIARSFLDYYKALGVIPTNVPVPIAASPEPRRRARSSRSASSRPRSRQRSSPRSTRSQALLHLHELPPEGRSGSSSSEGSPAIGAFPSARRSLAVPSPGGPAGDAATAGLRSLTGKKVGGGGIICRPDGPRTLAAPVVCSPPTPRLSIIDFNQLTRGGLDQATGRGRGRGRTRGGGRGRGRGRRGHRKSSP